MPNTISAIIITKNEASNIERCLKSLQSVVDEIIVVDSFSEDATQSICEKYKVQFHQRAFQDYSDQKNFANALANSDIILSIDADEVLSDQLQTSILKLKESFEADGYSMNRLTNYCGKWIKHCGWYPDNKLRIWKKGEAKWQGEIHETVILKGERIICLEGDLLHYSYPTIDSHVKTINNFSGLMAQDLFQKGRRSSFLKMVFAPFFDFLKRYFIKGGILDGYYGLIVCWLSGYYTFLKYAKLRDLHKQPSDQIIP